MGRKSREKRQRRQREREQVWGNDRRAERPIPKYPVQPKQSSGSTHAERYLAYLCRRTFLSTWSYPNVYRRETRPDGSFQGKEVCDLLVVFGRDVLIFSDKDIVFPKSNHVHRDWCRWYRRGVEKSASQPYGAERVIRAREPLFLDNKLQVPLPLEMPEMESMRVHRILVAHGASERCQEHLGGSGTLMIRPSLVGDDHVKPLTDGGTPFAIGRISASKGFVHVLDDASLNLLLRTMDTTPDLVEYLVRKEELLLSGHLAYAAGEEALVGLYQSAIDGSGKHFFNLGDTIPIGIDESWWDRYINGPEAAAKHKADAPSYLWDRLIERFATSFRDGTADHLTRTDTTTHARILQFFAREGRLRRRVMVEAILDMIETTKPHMRRLRVIPPTAAGDPYWVLLVFPYLRKVTPQQNRITRRWFLEACAMVTKLMNPDALDIVGFATESGQSTSRSEDALYFDARGWTDEMANTARELQRDYKILTTANRIEVHVDEYPTAEELNPLNSLLIAHDNHCSADPATSRLDVL